MEAGETVDKETGEVIKKPKGKGSFWVSRKAIDVLLENKATAMQINAYLVLAKHTNEAGKFSSSGMKAIHKATGAGHPVCKKAVEELGKMGLKKPVKGMPANLVYAPQEWSNLTGEAIPPAPFERAEARHVVNDYQAAPDERVWFSNELVAGIGKFTQPLKRLKQCGDVAARLLLLCYREHNLEQFGGISPTMFYEKYAPQKMCGDVNGFDVWHGSNENTTAYNDAAFPSLGIQAWPKDKDEKGVAIKPFWDAIKALDSAGFIYQMVSVLDREASNAEAQVMYELDAKSKHGYKPKGEEGVAGMAARIANRLGYPVTDAKGRFYGKYAAIVPAGVTPHILGIYRLRFRVSNAKNQGVTDAWARINQSQRDAHGWLNDLDEKTKPLIDEMEDAERLAEASKQMPF